MDGQRFDALTRNLATTSRRRALGLLAGGALGGVLAKVGLADAAAQDADRRRRRDRDDDRNRDDDGNAGDRCTASDDCGPALECCNRRCVNTQTDEANCGACGQTCGRNESCLNGGCFRTCRSAQAGICNTNACGDLCGCNTVFNNDSDGGGVCESLRGSCSKARACGKNNDCPDGLVCVNDGCCPGKPKVCARPCGTSAAPATAASADEITRVPTR